MVMEHFQIYGIQITGKCICQSNIHYDPPPPQAKPSPVSYHHPQGNGKSLISQGLIFLKMQFPLAEEGRWGEVGGYVGQTLYLHCQSLIICCFFVKYLSIWTFTKLSDKYITKKIYSKIQSTWENNIKWGITSI